MKGKVPKYYNFTQAFESLKTEQAIKKYAGGHYIMVTLRVFRNDVGCKNT